MSVFFLFFNAHGCTRSASETPPHSLGEANSGKLLPNETLLYSRCFKGCSESLLGDWRGVLPGGRTLCSAESVCLIKAPGGSDCWSTYIDGSLLVAWLRAWGEAEACP